MNVAWQDIWCLCLPVNGSVGIVWEKGERDGGSNPSLLVIFTMSVSIGKL
jgi:hypothetical protein